MSDTETVTETDTETDTGGDPTASRPGLVTVRVKIRWSDEDGFGHVNNAVYLNYLEEARDLLLESLFGEASYDYVLARVAIDYQAEITHRDLHVEVDSWITGHGSSSVRTAEEIRKLDGTVAARCEAVVVPRDGESRGSRPLRPAEVHALTAAGSVGPADASEQR
jgi:acyl-CoA thioester hydrolase